ncbi:MAG: efflux RND transporter permease subunit, partial [Flavitalea sp.]
MWGSAARFILRYKIPLMILLAAITVFMAFQASKVELSYEFSKAIPTDNKKYIDYQEFRKNFGEDGNLLVLGVKTDQFFQADFFNRYAQLVNSIKKVNSVVDVLNVPQAINLVKDTTNEKLTTRLVFPQTALDQHTLDSSAAIFKSLPFYQGLLYNPENNSYLMGIRINRDVMNSKGRTKVVNDIVKIGEEFSANAKTEVYYSGLPFIRTGLANRVSNEMRYFLLGSLLLSALILVAFFRSSSATLLSLGVVIIGVIWSFGTMQLFGYKITLLNALIPPLVVVIGIPNCIYFLNKYHTSFREYGNKEKSLVEMISKMGIVTLFCNIAAAIGFAVFALTKSTILKEFGVVAGINIMALFFISIILIPSVLSMLPSPKPRHTKYLDNKWLLTVLDRLEIWSLNHQKTIYTVTAVILVFSILGIFRLRSEGFIVDDLPKSDKIYTDMKFFEQNFKGVMPLEIVIDTKRKNGLRANMLQTFEKIDSLSVYVSSQKEMARPLSIVEGMKFAKQAYYDGDSSNYSVPNSFDIAFLAQYLSVKGGEGNNFTKLVSSFMDSTRQQTRVSINMADVGSKKLQVILDTLENRTSQLFDTSKYKVTLTGSSVTFLEGSAFIINGLKESIFWAFLLIALCMLYLFRSGKILISSLIPNIIPLIITAGVMGWAGIRIKPSTVLVFSVALGIAIDITIRFLVNYKQELEGTNRTASQVVIDTIHKTGISIIYTSLVLIAGFVIFCFSGFGGTQALGWLTSLTLILATITNLVFLPVILLAMV